MSILDTKKTYKNLKKKGFVVSKNKSPDHRRIEFFYKKKFVLSTMVSHSGKDLDNYLIRQMSEQCHLGKDEFIDFAQCRINKEDYIKILDQKGLLD
jgi:predicted RNA binding protein YcfA (HicA-like mRNA interferase family)